MSDDTFGDDIKGKPKADEALLFSVTTVLKSLAGEGLIYWACEQSAIKAVKIHKTLAARIEEEGVEAVVKLLRDARFERVPGVRTASELGTAVHGKLQEYALTGRMPVCDEEEQPFLDEFDKWCQLFQPSYEAAEMTVFSPTYGVAGTLDAIATIDGHRYLIDYKTSRRSEDKWGKPTSPYPEAALQVAAYRHAEFAVPIRPRRFEKYRRRYYLWGSPEQEAAVPMPEVEGALVLHVTPKHCVPYPVACGPRTYDAFLYVLEVTRWMSEHASAAIGEPLEPPVRTLQEA